MAIRTSLLLFFHMLFLIASAQENPRHFTINKLFASYEFYPDRYGDVTWSANGEAYYRLEYTESGVDIWKHESSTGEGKEFLTADQLIPPGENEPVWIEDFTLTQGEEKMLIYTNSQRVWRENTRGDYWVYDFSNSSLRQLGKDRPESSLMFAKFPPGLDQVAYVSESNIYLEDLETGLVQALTTDGTIDLINGTFDWAYEEEFFCKDGFRWSPDGRYLAFWQIDASGIKDFQMINYTDSIYSYTIPVQYSKVGETPSSAKIGVIEKESGKITWLQIEGDPHQNYLPRMQWVGSSNQILVKQLNRKQNQLNLWVADPVTGEARIIHTETDNAWIDIDHMDLVTEWKMYDVHFLENNQDYLWISEKDGWRHVYIKNINSDRERLLTPGEYDIAALYGVNSDQKFVYFNASPQNSTQRYLFRIPIKGKSKLERLTPQALTGVCDYNLAPGLSYAIQSFSNTTTPPIESLVSLSTFRSTLLEDNQALNDQLESIDLPLYEFFEVTTSDGITMDGYMIKPPDFDASLKYPVVFYVYGEPATQTASNKWSGGWHKMLAQRGYLVISMDNRGTPCLKGREWRKSLYRKVGVINSHDQAMATQEIMKWEFVDPNRTAVWGWSGGGAMTLNLLFRYPEIYETGISVAPVTNQLYYDNIYQERYMGLPWENEKDYIEGSPITFANNLQGNLLLVHGTGDDNVHYQNSEALINELIKHDKQFRVMPYPNRSHGIYEGENTTRHLYRLMLNYLEEKVEPGGK